MVWPLCSHRTVTFQIIIDSVVVQLFIYCGLEFFLQRRQTIVEIDRSHLSIRCLIMHIFIQKFLLHILLNAKTFTGYCMRNAELEAYALRMSWSLLRASKLKSIVIDGGIFQ